MSVKCMFFQDSEIEEFELNDALMNDCITAYPDEIELMQSTGILDKNGKEIFEGDILKFNDEWNEYCHEGYVDGSVEGVNYVEVVKGEACFEFGKTRYPESSLFIYMEDEHLSFAELVKDKDFGFEIIGNIYENLVFLEDK
ncbi:phage protein [Streptococcus pneumoniae]|uniref:YopX family protein n=1 Tax=Streptococcus pneumoniae TaxID=1313 RepID=UPI00076985B2|nr:phage protein [Streptococcus pneumoniae]VJA45992.1 phage protein [Streptococcus pneumoniae]VJB81437.1 phage protein [Streptococcus pneumoniae]VMG93601.1 phage protein [Streptococcus pneumoniae]VNV80597.1 phage protein [Streptococcus pneumoniae]